MNEKNTVAYGTTASIDQSEPAVAPLRVYRAARGWSQAELAERAGLHRFTISTLETGLHSPRLRTAHALALALGVDVEALWPTHSGVRR